MKHILNCLVATFAFFLPSIATATVTEFPSVSGSKDTTLRIASVTDLPIFLPMIEAFQQRYPDIAISYEESTSNTLDVVLEKSCLAETDFADLVISSSLPRQVWFVNEGCAAPLGEVAGKDLPGWAQWRNEILGLTYEPAVIVYNKAAIPESLAPRNRFDFIDLLRNSSAYTGKVGTYDIESSGVGYFLAFEDSEQASTWGRLLESFGRNQVKLFCCTGDILDRVADGRLLFGYNVLGSYALDRMRHDNRLGIILPSDYTLVMTRTAFIPKTAKATAAAKLFINFVLSAEGQSILKDRMNFASPLHGPEGLKERLIGGVDSLRPIALSPALLVPLDQEKKRVFIEQWRQSIRPEKVP